MTNRCHSPVQCAYHSQRRTPPNKTFCVQRPTLRNTPSCDWEDCRATRGKGRSDCPQWGSQSRGKASNTCIVSPRINWNMTWVPKLAISPVCILLRESVRLVVLPLCCLCFFSNVNLCIFFLMYELAYLYIAIRLIANQHLFASNVFANRMSRGMSDKMRSWSASGSGLFMYPKSEKANLAFTVL